MIDVADPAALVALARELEREGQYNAAKLARAAAQAQVVRAAYGVSAPMGLSAQADALREAADALADRVPALVPALRASADRLAAGGVALAVDAPVPVVCRLCGETRLGGFDGRCDICGAWPDTAEPVPAIYWLRASTPPEAMELLRRTPRAIEAIVRSHTREELDRPGPDGGWSARETLAHLHNAQAILRHRIDQLLTEDEPVLESVMAWTLDADSASSVDLFAAYISLRAEILSRLDDAGHHEFWNTGIHEEWGRVTLAEQVSYFANHEPTHLGQLADAAG